MTERKSRIHYVPIEQEPPPPFVDRQFLYQGTKIEPAKPKELRIKKGNRTVLLKQPRRSEIALVYVPITDTLLEIPRVTSSKLTSATPPIGDFPQITNRGETWRDLRVYQKPTKPRRSGSSLTTHYQVEKKPTRANRMTKSYETTTKTYWGSPTKDHPAVKKKLGKIKVPRL